MELILSAEEQRLLEEILEQRQVTLLREISHADHREFKLKLRRDESLVESMLNRLRVQISAKAS